jgi:hypothetical protein
MRYLSSVVQQGVTKDGFSMRFALCESLYDLHLALYAFRSKDYALLYAPCPLRSFVCTADFFMDDPYLFKKSSPKSLGVKQSGMKFHFS